MKKVITYGTYDLLHHGHIRLLERAKALGDYLIVGVTADDFDKTRGKINVQQSLMERVEAVKNTGLADMVIIEEYEGQKIDDILKYDVDIFTVGSDWVGYFDYLNEYCTVHYLPRTEGVSSSELRQSKRSLNLGLVGDSEFLNKFADESSYVNGVNLLGICTKSLMNLSEKIKGLEIVTDNYDELLAAVDAVYIRSVPEVHYVQIKKALEAGKHVLCESPITLNDEETIELQKLAQDKGLILMDAIKTAYSTAYNRLLLLVKTGKIGDVVSVDATCTSLAHDYTKNSDGRVFWENTYEWGPTALLPIFQILGTKYKEKRIITRFADEDKKHDSFSEMCFVYDKAVATIKVGTGVKSEGSLVISGTKGYVYVPAPWWKTDYFEIRYENQSDNKRYFYQLDGEGIRYELVAFVKSVERGKKNRYITDEISEAMVSVMEDFTERKDMFCI